MKPTDEERREMARRLRELAAANGGKLGMARLNAVLGESQAILGTRGLESVAHVIERHADLIDPVPERTCENRAAEWNSMLGFDAYGFVCSECGCNEPPKDAKDPRMQLFETNYCRVCGAKVVR